MGWGAVQGITNNLAGRPLGRGFVLWAVLCGHAPLLERFCVWAAFCGAALLTTLWSALPPPYAFAFFQVFSSPFYFELPNLCFFMGGGGGSRDNQQFGRATFGARFCPVGRALWSCPVTGAVLCVGRFLRGCLADKLCGSPSPFPLLMPFFSSLFKSLLL